MVPHILQPTVVEECTVYSEELLSNSPDTLTAPVCRPPSRPDGGHVGPSRQQQEADLASFGYFGVDVDGVKGVF